MFTFDDPFQLQCMDDVTEIEKPRKTILNYCDKDFSPIDILDLLKRIDTDMGIMFCPSIQLLSDNRSDQMYNSERGLFEPNLEMYRALRVLSKEHKRYKDGYDKTIMNYLKDNGVISDLIEAIKVY